MRKPLIFLFKQLILKYEYDIFDSILFSADK